MFQHIPMQWKISFNKTTQVAKKIRVFLWGIELPRLVVSQDTFQASLPNCSSSENKSNLLMQFSFCSIPFLTVLKIKPHLQCTPSGTTSTSLPGHPILCIPSCQDIHWVASYTEVRTVLWVSCGLDQLSHHISIGIIPVTPVHREDENGRQHWLICATPQEKLHPKFQFSWKSPSPAHKHTPQEGAAVLSVTPQGNTNKPCAVGRSAPYNGQMYLACLGFRFFLIH